jgi:protein-disulfide isomerase
MENNGSSSCKLGIVVSFIALGVAAASYFYPPKAPEVSASSTFDEKVKGILIDLIKQNPQLLMDAMGEGMAKKREDTIKQLGNDVVAKKEEIYKQCLAFGKADSKNSIVCFFDPLCKHCIEFLRTMIKLLKENKDVSFMTIPVAVLGEDSVLLAKTYIAVYGKSPEKAIVFVEKITKEGSTMDKSAIEKALKESGLDPKEIEKTLDVADKKLSSNGVMAESLKIPVVPAIFVIQGTNVNMVQATGIDDILPFIEPKPEPGKASESTPQTPTVNATN